MKATTSVFYVFTAILVVSVPPASSFAGQMEGVFRLRYGSRSPGTYFGQEMMDGDDVHVRFRWDSDTPAMPSQRPRDSSRSLFHFEGTWPLLFLNLEFDNGEIVSLEDPLVSLLDGALKPEFLTDPSDPDWLDIMWLHSETSGFELEFGSSIDGLFSLDGVQLPDRVEQFDDNLDVSKHLTPGGNVFDAGGTLVVRVVPEPDGLGMVFGALIAVLLLRRRKR